MLYWYWYCTVPKTYRPFFRKYLQKKSRSFESHIVIGISFTNYDFFEYFFEIRFFKNNISIKDVFFHVQFEINLCLRANDDIFSRDIATTIIQTLIDNDHSSSTLHPFFDLKAQHEGTLFLFVYRTNCFLLAGYQLTKRSTQALIDTLRVACPYAPDTRLFVSCLPAAEVRHRVAHAIDSRRGDIISLAEMEWSWDILRLADLLSDEVDNFNAFVL